MKQETDESGAPLPNSLTDQQTTSNDKKVKRNVLQTIRNWFRSKKSSEPKGQQHSKISEETFIKPNPVSVYQSNKNERNSSIQSSGDKHRNIPSVNVNDNNLLTRKISGKKKIQPIKSEKNQNPDTTVSIPSISTNDEIRIVESNQTSIHKRNQSRSKDQSSHSFSSRSKVIKIQPPKCDSTKVISKELEKNNKPSFNSRNVTLSSSFPIRNSNRYDQRDYRSSNTTKGISNTKVVSKETNVTVETTEDTVTTISKIARKDKIKDDMEIKFKLFIDWPTNAFIEMYMCGKGIDKNSPIGFENPSGYCYLNSVVQVIVSCKDFIKDLEAFDKWDSCETNTDTLFVRGLFDLICALRKRNHKKVASALNRVQLYINESAFGDDVYKCFMNLLTRVSKVIKCGSRNTEQAKLSTPVASQQKANASFKKLQNRNPGFVFNNFYGQITFQTICKICKKICNESFQMIKSLPLPVPMTERSVTLNECIDLFINASDVEVESPMKCDCPGGTSNLKSVTRITHAPKYMFIYLNRGSYNEDSEKNETTVTCDHTIKIETTTGFKEYQLISVIDHIGNSSHGHYYCKCNYETYNWCLVNDTEVDLISNKEVVTKQAIVFLFKQL